MAGLATGSVRSRMTHFGHGPLVVLLAEGRPTCLDLGDIIGFGWVLDGRASGTATSGCAGGGYRRL
jgi:hypothetical protein